MINTEPAARVFAPASTLDGDASIIAGESAVAGLAGVIAAMTGPLKKQLGLTRRSRVLLIGSEGATDAEIYDQLMAQ